MNGSSEDTGKDPLEELVERFLAEKPGDVEGFLRRHPEHADELRELLPALEMLGERGKALVEGSLENGRTLLERLRRMREGIAAGVSLERPPPARTAAKGALDDYVSALIARVEAHGYPVGRFEPGGELARGGQGVVLAVWDETLRRHLAMKVALPASDGGATARPSEARSLGRFLEEALVTAQLDHPGIVPIHDLGLDSERRVYFTMKLVKGRDLRAIFELVHTGEEGWTVTRALSVLLKVCEAMAYAHSKGVIHRDLKPSNVMVGKFGEVYVMDWGLARVLGAEDRKDIRIHPAPTSAMRSLRREDGREELDSPLVTMDGDVVGTPAYMPPEQARGELGAIGPHSDVYAVGAMLYQLLTGRMPYVSTGSGLSNRAIWALVQRGPPDPVHELAPEVPPELAAICDKAMTREVPSRYPDMGALAEELRAYLEHRIVRAYQTGALAELRKWIGRNRGLAAAIAAGVVLALGGLAGVGYVQAEGKKVADAERASVLRLSAFQELEDLEREADELWPPEPRHLKAYEEWLRKARKLVAALDPSPDGSSKGHRAQLAELEARALPYPDAEREEDRRSHPRLAELEDLKKKLEAFRKAQAVREGRARVAEVVLEETLQGAAQGVLLALSEALTIPERTIFGEEARGLALARRATSMESSNPYMRANSLNTLAWALHANGLDETAIASSEAALAYAPAENREEFQKVLEHLRASVEAGWRNPVIPALEAELAAIEVELPGRRAWRFVTNEDRWWHDQLQKLIAELEAFANPETGLIEGLSPEHGWGIARRRGWAERVEELTLSSAEAARLWTEALASIRDPEECAAYAGLVIEPQLGLVPIGRDATSGLWEFAHPLSGAVPKRGPDGKLVLTEESALVFVLLPGGAFQMGAQCTDPAGAIYDPWATPDEFPVHGVELTPFFISKYEVTQGQWLRSTGRNPSYSKPPDLHAPSLLHPVEGVTWDDCDAFCRRLGLQLSSEAQWEYAARGGTTTPWWTGNERDTLVDAVNLADLTAAEAKQPWPAIQDWPELDDGYVMHAPVDRFRANPFGLHGMIGNLWEWCLDYWDRGFYTHSPAVDPVAPRASSRFRVFRGSSYGDSAAMGRSTFRSASAPETASSKCGPRPARAIVGEVRWVPEARAWR